MCMTNRRETTPEWRSRGVGCGRARGLASHRRVQGGLTLIELLIFIVVVSVALVGVLMVFNTAVRGSADPMVRKQALAIAESLLTEIEQQPFTYCDLQDANLATATGTANCAVAANDQNSGGAALTRVPASESRYSATDPFDNVADYAGFSQANIPDITNSNAMAGYTASVAISRAGDAFPAAGAATLASDAVLKIDVTVAGHGESITLTGYRFRYAPNL